MPDVYAFAVVEYMPDWVKDVIKNAFPRRTEDFSDLQRQLQELLNGTRSRCKGGALSLPASLPRKRPASMLLRQVTEKAAVFGANNNKSLRTPRRRFHETPEGATTTVLYEIYEKAPEIIMLDTVEQVEEKGLRGKAATFFNQTGVLFVNGLYEAVDRTVGDIEPEFIGQANRKRCAT